MSGMRGMRIRVVALGAVGVLALGCAGAGSDKSVGSTATSRPLASGAVGARVIPSSQFWAAKAGEALTERPVAAPVDASYQGNTDAVFLNLVKQARALGHTGHAWKNIGPFGGVVDINGTGSGAELFGPVAGIGTAITVDPGDKTGNTAYLGTIGGLYKTTDGGKTIH